MVNEGIPEVRKTDVETLRLRSKVAAALPPMQNVSSDPLVGYSTKVVYCKFIGSSNAPLTYT